MLTDAILAMLPQIPEGQPNALIPTEGWTDDLAKAATRKAYMTLDIDPVKLAFIIHAAIDAAVNHFKVEVRTNVREGIEIPDTFTWAILPISTHDKQNSRNRLECIGVLAVPSIVALAEEVAGQNFIQNAVGDSMLSSCSRAMKNGDTLPFRLAEFTTQGGQHLEAWRNLRGPWLTIVREHGLKKMDPNNFEMCLRSQPWVESTGFAKVPIEQWNMVLNAMINQGKQNGWNTVALETWRDTRMDETIEFGELSLTEDSLAALFNSPTPAEGADTPATPADPQAATTVAPTSA